MLYLFSCDIELNAAFPDGIPDGLNVAITGVGLVDAALGTAAAIARYRPEAIAFLGTCGAHRGSGLSVGDLVIASGAALGSGDVVRGGMRLPKIMASRLQTDEVLSARFTDVATADGMAPRSAWISCTLGVTENDQLASALRGHDGSEAENLEVFSVLRAAGSIPVTALLGVTNIVGAGGGADWAANYRSMMLMLGALVAGM